MGLDGTIIPNVNGDSLSYRDIDFWPRFCVIPAIVVPGLVYYDREMTRAWEATGSPTVRALIEEVEERGESIGKNQKR
jgi:hypothetical protein